MTKVGLRAYARELYRLYRAAMFTEVDQHTNRHRAPPPLKTQPLSVQEHFTAAALSCQELGVSPRLYLVAQFSAFAAYSTALKKRVLPMPNQLYGLAAQARYLRYQAEKQDRDDRSVVHIEKQVRGFYREERRLRGLVRMLRLTPDEVLTSRPTDFSREFLRAKFVWSLVADRFEHEM
jgi:hypothetical protein